MRLSYAYLNETQEWAAPAPGLLEQQRPPSVRTRPAATPARREQLAELDALTDQIQPLLDRLDTTWRALETDLGWRGRRRAVP